MYLLTDLIGDYNPFSQDHNLATHTTLAVYVDFIHD